jgi:hypothetical protein
MVALDLVEVRGSMVVRPGRTVPTPKKVSRPTKQASGHWFSGSQNAGRGQKDSGSNSSGSTCGKKRLTEKAIRITITEVHL